MANIWTPEAERLTPSGTPGNLMGGGAKAILHVTVSGSGGSNFAAMHRVLIGKQAEPHYLYDPITDRLGQYFPLNRSSRSLGTGSGPVSCNRAGSRLIQIEVVAWPGSADGLPRNSAPTTKGGFTAIWKPGPNFRAMMRDIRANGVPERFPLGSTASGCPRASFSSYQSGSGWYGHCHVPYQSHWDPGVIDQAAFFAAATTTPAPVAPQEADMQWTDKIPGTNVTLQQAVNRGNWAYDQCIDGGSIDNRIDALRADLTRVGAALAADDKAKAQAILDQIQISLSVKPETPPPAA